MRGHTDIADEYQADWRVGRADLAEFLGAWAQAGFSPDPPQPEAVMVGDGRTLHRYRMVYVGLPGWNKGRPENAGRWAE